MRNLVTFFLGATEAIFLSWMVESDLGLVKAQAMGDQQEASNECIWTVAT
jgi:hypothetical protein